MKYLRIFISLYLLAIGTVACAVCENFDDDMNNVFYKIYQWAWLKSSDIDINREVWNGK